MVNRHVDEEIQRNQKIALFIKIKGRCSALSFGFG